MNHRESRHEVVVTEPVHPPLKKPNILSKIQEEACCEDKNTSHSMTDTSLRSLVLTLPLDVILIGELTYNNSIANANECSAHEADTHAFLGDCSSQRTDLADGRELPEGVEAKRAETRAEISQTRCVDERFLESLRIRGGSSLFSSRILKAKETNCVVWRYEAVDADARAGHSEEQRKCRDYG